MKLVYKKLEKKKMKAIVVDNIGGLYLPIAQKLTEYFDVYYHTVVQNPFPRMSTCNVGLEYDFKVVNNFWSDIDNYDLFIFPDIYFKDWGTHLRKMGKMVWGATKGEDLETNRKLFKQELSQIGLPIAHTEYYKGIKDLSKNIRKLEDKWAKISYFRGDMETFHHINWRQSEMWVNDLSKKLGPLGSELEFMIEDGIESVAEIGGDGWLVNGKNTDSFIWGIEVKDCGYIGKASHINMMPDPVKNIYSRFSQVTQKYNHTGFYSTEIRVGEDGSDYYTDPCMRAGSPPSSTYMEMVTNWDEIIIGGCRGELIEPQFAGKYGAEIILKSNYCNSNYLPVGFDKKYKQNIKMKGSFIQDGKNYIIPFSQAGIEDMDAWGSVVVVGDSVENIVNQALTIADSLDCYGLSYDENALDKAKDSLTRIEQALNITF
jgi:hypothetical protein